ncbi:polysaccharide lyase family 11 protein [Melanomma pulvis-pyrius CBS 109.77]|uniref:Polysaccharide lyase family 11 protein n=1 Tax=Melanomma pulvis-pyrius CBS 109.77 TaxID=1314802 RepID=A0A6A6XIK0_9PLEO|nr:polysaccharide lyase family 11 protein [Melanomma pulvis-pyrius CBS 109.77]
MKLLLFVVAVATSSVAAIPARRQSSPRPMENLGRGVVAVRANKTAALVSWRLLGLDDNSLGFNIYRSTNSAGAMRLNSDVLTKGTNYLDSGADLSKSNRYWVRSVIDGKEQSPASGSFTLPADNAVEPIVRIPINAGDRIKYVWVGDLDGDGEYDFVIDRHGTQQGLEAYRRDGKRLWKVSMGPNSENQNNIEPGSSGIDVGHWDGVTVYDLDSDGIAEVAVRISNGVVFGDGKTFTEGKNNDKQFIAVLDGKTGALRAATKIKNEYIKDGPFAARLGVGYLDGERPHIVGFMKNRMDNNTFNRNLAAWIFDGVKVSEEWVYDDRNAGSGSDGHNTRIVDVDGDGKDEVGEIMFMLNGDGKLRYDMTTSGIGHGDRWQIAKIDPSRPGLQGYGVQQNNPSKLWEYYYDARDGKVLWKHYGDQVTDIGRGMVGDIDPDHPGMESWSAGGNGLYNAPSDTLLEQDTKLSPWAHLGLWWDGDDTMELYNDGKIEKWDPSAPTASNKLPRILQIANYGAINPGDPNPGFLGDIFGDWREEVIVTNAAYDELIIFTTDRLTERRLYTLAHNPNYRNGMTMKGYLQNAHTDYFIGKGMKTPTKPNIRYVGT